MVSISQAIRQNGKASPAIVAAPGAGGSGTRSSSGSKRQSLLSFFLGACCTYFFLYRIQDSTSSTVKSSMSRLVDCPTTVIGGGAGDVVVGANFDDGEHDNSEHQETPHSLRKQQQQQLPVDVSTTTKDTIETDWKWYEGDVNQYYNELEKDIQRDPTNLEKYAVHRWMGPSHSTTIHYQLLLESIVKYTGRTRDDKIANLNVLDAGCGLGSALMFFEQHNPSWTLHGRTLSEEQINFVTNKLPPHKFTVQLGSYNALPDDQTYDVIYSVEAMIHSTDIHATLRAWAEHLHPHHGSIVVIDDFLMPGASKDDPEMQFFQKGWMANSFYTVTQLASIARQYGLELVESRDLLAEYRVIELNYMNQAPNLNPDGTKTHQGWMGSKWRHKLTVEGKIAYNMIVFQKIGAHKVSMESLLAFANRAASSQMATVDSPNAKAEGQEAETCQALPTISDGDSAAPFTKITPKNECISSWYCCDQGTQWFDNIAAKRTHEHGFLKMERTMFGNYMDVFAKHLNKLYETMPEGYTRGRFLDIGATGSTASGMQQVTTKFAHFTGNMEYWMLDSDVGAKNLNHTIYCDIVDCPQAETCGFDVTFSHTVLEHASRPEKTFDTIARITKKGGLTMHLVPWSYQYHATPDDYYRFSHSALRVLVRLTYIFMVVRIACCDCLGVFL